MASLASLLQRMDIVPATGAIRGRRRGAGPAPYKKPSKAPDGMWTHDLYNGPGKTLSSRLSDGHASIPSGTRKVDLTIAQLAIREATKGDHRVLNIKGASTGANVVQVAGLLKGTTAADVEAIFKRFGPIVKSAVVSPNGETVTVRLTFKMSADAKEALKYDGKTADGQILEVTLIGSANATLSGRLGAGVTNGSVDQLLAEDPDAGGSKMRSDDVLRSDPRAQVLTVPPGANPVDYQQQTIAPRGRGGRGRGNGRRRRGGGGGKI